MRNQENALRMLRIENEGQKNDIERLRTYSDLLLTKSEDRACNRCSRFGANAGHMNN